MWLITEEVYLQSHEKDTNYSILIPFTPYFEESTDQL